MRLWCLVLSGALFVITLIRPALFHAPNLIWTQCGRLLGRVVNPILMGLLFYLVFTPVAIVLRWRGKDLLHLAASQTEYLLDSAQCRRRGVRHGESILRKRKRTCLS